jgi:hypothetical protein
MGVRVAKCPLAIGREWARVRFPEPRLIEVG